MTQPFFIPSYPATRSNSAWTGILSFSFPSKYASDSRIDSSSDKGPQGIAARRPRIGLADTRRRRDGRREQTAARQARFRRRRVKAPLLRSR